MEKMKKSVDRNVKIKQLTKEKLDKQSSSKKKLSFQIAKKNLNELKVHKIELEMQNDELRKTQLELIESNEKYIDLYNSAPVAFFSLSNKGIIKEANLTAVNLLGVEKSLLINQPLSRFIGNDDQEIYSLHFKNLIETRMKQQLDVRIKGKDRPLFYASLIAVPVVQTGRTFIIRVTISDINERLLTEEKSARNDNLFRLLVEHSPASIAMFDREMNYIITSSRFLIDYELGNKNVTGHSHYEIFPEIPDRWKEIHRRCLNGETLRADEDTFMRASGKLDWIKWEICPWYESNHKIGGIILFSEVITERKRMEDNLRESEARYRMIYENSPLGIYRTTPDGQILLANPALLNMLHYTSFEELSVKNLEKDGIEPLYNRKLFVELMENTGEVNGLKSAWTGNDRSIIYVRENTRRVRDSGGKTLYYDGMVEDITEQKIAGEQLRKLSLAIEHSPVSIVITDVKGDIEYVNPKFTEITGYTLKEVLNQNPRVLKSGMQPPEYYKNLWDTILSGKGWSGALFNKKKNGEHFWESAKISSIKNEAGKITHFVAIKEDITDKVEIENELKKYREHLEELVNEKTEQLTKQNLFFRTLIGTIPNPIYVLDIEHRFTEVNKSYEEYFGTTRDNVLGKTIFDISPIETAEIIKQQDDEVLNNHNTIVFEFFSQIEGKGKIPVLVYKSSFGLTEKKPEGITALIIDISKQKEMEKTILEALKKEKELNELKSNFISMASHEFRTPLTTILSSTELLEKYHQKWEEENIMGHYKKVKVSVQYMIGLLDEVLTISRSDRGKIHFNPSTINVREFSIEIIEQIKMQALPAQNIIFDCKLPYQDINADPTLLNHILSNLLTNAVKFSPAGGDITLSVEEEKEFIKFTIIDSGIGIPAEDIPNLFNPFFRAQNSTGIKGTGLGLSIVKRYVELHNGEISLETTPGRGTMFSVKIKKEI